MICNVGFQINTVSGYRLPRKGNLWFCAGILPPGTKIANVRLRGQSGHSCIAVTTSAYDPTRTFIAAQRPGSRGALDDCRECVPSGPNETAMFQHGLGFDDSHRLRAFDAPRGRRFYNSTHHYCCQTGRLVLRFRYAIPIAIGRDGVYSDLPLWTVPLGGLIRTSRFQWRGAVSPTRTSLRSCCQTKSNHSQ